LATPEVKPLLSSEHVSVDGTLLRAWASHSSLERIDGLDDDPPQPSGGKGVGGPSSSKKRAKGDFCGLLLSTKPIAPAALERRCYSRRFMVLMPF